MDAPQLFIGERESRVTGLDPSETDLFDLDSLEVHGFASEFPEYPVSRDPAGVCAGGSDASVFTSLFDAETIFDVDDFIAVGPASDEVCALGAWPTFDFGKDLEFASDPDLTSALDDLCASIDIGAAYGEGVELAAASGTGTGTPALYLPLPKPDCSRDESLVAIADLVFECDIRLGATFELVRDVVTRFPFGSIPDVAGKRTGELPLSTVERLLDPEWGVLRSRRAPRALERIAFVEVEVVDSCGASSGVYTVPADIPFTPPGIADALAKTHGLSFRTPWRLGERDAGGEYYVRDKFAWDNLAPLRTAGGAGGAGREDLKSLVLFVSSVPSEFRPGVDARYAAAAEYLEKRASVSTYCDQETTVLILSHEMSKGPKGTAAGRQTSIMDARPTIIAVPSAFATLLAAIGSKTDERAEPETADKRREALGLVAAHVSGLVNGGTRGGLSHPPVLPDVVISVKPGAPPGSLYGWCVWEPGSLQGSNARVLFDGSPAALKTALVAAPFDEDSEIISEILDRSDFHGDRFPPKRRRFSLAFRVSQLGPDSCALGVTVYTPWRAGGEPCTEPAFVAGAGGTRETPLLARIAECGVDLAGRERGVDRDRHALEMSTYRSVAPTVRSILDVMEQPRETDERDRLVAGRKAAYRGRGLSAVQPLSKHQMEAIEFMLDTEAPLGGVGEAMWTKIPLPYQPPGDTGRPVALYWSRVLRRASFEPPEPQHRGGMLCDDAGLGHKATIAALIASDRRSPIDVPCQRSAIRPTKATLIVCRPDTIGRWREVMVNAFSKRGVAVYHGSGRAFLTADRIATELDVVLTTYDTVTKDWIAGGAVEDSGSGNEGESNTISDNRSRIHACPLYGVRFHRVIFDEGQCLANRSWAKYKACSAIEATRRWVRTSKPVYKRVGELCGMFAALRSDRYFSNPDNYESNEMTGEFWPRLLWFVRRSCLRRKLSAVQGGLPGVGKSSEVAVSLSQEERAFYSSAEKEAAEGFAELLKDDYGPSNDVAISRLLMPMRRICGGGVLSNREMRVEEPAGATKRKYEEGVETTDLAPPTRGGEDANCPICLGELSRPVATECGHWFCKSCISRCIVSEKSKATCPMCRKRVTLGKLRVPQSANIASANIASANIASANIASANIASANIASPGPKSNPDARYLFDAKPRATDFEIRRVLAADPSAKLVVFTDFYSSARRLRELLNQGPGVGHATMNGSSSASARSNAASEFQNGKRVSVLVVAGRTNVDEVDLTAANKIIFMEPPLDPADRERAIGTVLRHGQKRTVDVTHMYVSGTIEERQQGVWREREAVGRACRVTANSSASVGEVERTARSVSCFNRSRNLV